MANLGKDRDAESFLLACELCNINFERLKRSAICRQAFLLPVEESNLTDESGICIRSAVFLKAQRAKHSPLAQASPTIRMVGQSTVADFRERTNHSGNKSIGSRMINVLGPSSISLLASLSSSGV